MEVGREQVDDEIPLVKEEAKAPETSTAHTQQQSILAAEANDDKKTRKSSKKKNVEQNAVKDESNMNMPDSQDDRDQNEQSEHDQNEREQNEHEL